MQGLVFRAFRLGVVGSRLGFSFFVEEGGGAP